MDPGLLLSAIPADLARWLPALLLVLPLLALIEGLVTSWRRPGAYDWRAFAASMADAVVRRSVDALGLSLAAPLAAQAHAHRLGDIGLDTPHAVIALFLGVELSYYAMHRASHRVRWFWASHAVHHSPNQLTLAAALRLGWTGRLSGTVIFFTPLVWIGFDPVAVFGTLAIVLLYQFGLHAPWIPRLGPLEWVFNTPSHHRVHHACNAEYLDCNYGGVLIVFDRLLGTFVAERDDVAPRFGLTEPLTTHNPLHIALHGWYRLLADLARCHSPLAVLRTLFGPPPAAPDRLSSPRRSLR